MRTLIALELRRNRMVFASLFGLLALSILYIFFLGMFYGSMLNSKSMAMLLTSWVFSGVSLAQAVLGLTAGARTRNAGDVSAENLVPVAPWHRAYAGLAASLVCGLVFCGVLWLMLGFVLAGKPLSADLAIRAMTCPMEIFCVGVMTYTFAYAFGSVVLGLVASLVCLALLCTPLFVWRDPFMGGLLLCPEWVECSVLVLVICGLFLAALALRAQTVALCPSNFISRNCLAGVLILLAPVLCAAGIWGQLVWAENVRLESDEVACYSDAKDACAKFQPGLFASSERGQVDFVKPDGSVHNLLPASYHGFWPLSRHGVGRALKSAMVDKDGALWLSVRVPVNRHHSKLQIWRFGTDGSRKLVFEPDENPRYGVFLFQDIDGKLLMLPDNGGNRVAEVPSAGQSVRWVHKTGKDWGLRNYFIGKTFVPEGKNAVAGLVNGKRRVFILPFPLAHSYPIWIKKQGDVMSFWTTLREGEKEIRYYVSCHTDGKVDWFRQPAWPAFAMPQGAGWAWSGFSQVQEALVVWKKDGASTFSNLYLAGALSEALGRNTGGCMLNLLRAKDGVLDLLAVGKLAYLLRVDMHDGRLLSKIPIAVPVHLKRVLYCYALEDGFFASISPSLYKIKWDGTVKKVLN